ncbi:MAG TPA: hypothetical protein VD861_14675 [Pyrinomonadaceae bacterium]|nr:hypothetical protein [Pyrinomonadaceae bacterium]
MPRYTFDTNIIKGYKVERLPENFYMSSVVLSELMTRAVAQRETGEREAGNGNYGMAKDFRARIVASYCRLTVLTFTGGEDLLQ